MKIIPSAHPAVARFLDAFVSEGDEPPPRNSTFLPNVSEESYNEMVGIRSSHIKAVNRSDAHLMYELTNQSEPSKSQSLGILVHAAALFPETPLPVMEIPDDLSLATREAKDTKAIAQSKGLTLIRESELDKVRAMAEIIRSDPDIALALSTSYNEASVAVTVPITLADKTRYLRLKARVDAFPKGSAIVDIKTTTDARADAFAWTCVRYGYHCAAYHYLTILNHASKDPNTQIPEAYRDHKSTVMYVAIETEPPYCMAKYCLNESFLNQGAMLWAQATERMIQLMEKGETSGYPSGITLLKPPADVSNRYVEEVWG